MGVSTQEIADQLGLTQGAVLQPVFRARQKLRRALGRLRTARRTDVDCLEFRRTAGADPQHLEPAALAHARGCRAARRTCANCGPGRAHPAALRVTAVIAGRRWRPRLPGSERLDRRRWMHSPASIVGACWWNPPVVGNPRHSLAQTSWNTWPTSPVAARTHGTAGRPGRGRRGARARRGSGCGPRPSPSLTPTAASFPRPPRAAPRGPDRGGPVTVMVLRRTSAGPSGRFPEPGLRGPDRACGARQHRGDRCRRTPRVDHRRGACGREWL